MTAEPGSAAFFTALRAALATVELPGEGSLRVGQLVTGAPAGLEPEWTFVLVGGSAPELVVGSTSTAEVVLVTAYDDAAALASGERTPAELLGEGRITIRGDARRLVDGAALLAAVAGAMAARSR